jgi:predicted RNase H-like HicB family nuclease
MGKEYKIITWFSQEDHAFIGQVPQLPGCMADGHTEDEAVANARIAISHWIQTAQELGREIPQP